MHSYRHAMIVHNQTKETSVYQTTQTDKSSSKNLF